ncbi:hypothetical protein [Mycolicibacterium tusciae]|uniref:hypothetical protein n=1 Tax=Mycolicibacterium tusciae TaxID=75922 RepID=UPI00024A36F8|nr:hypothetical protein [Mycolicibacterium tusciae]
MRPVGKRRLLRREVAAKSMPALRVPVRNLLSPIVQLTELIEYPQTSGTSALRVMIPPDWDDTAGCGGVGGCRNLSFVSEPFSGAA